MSKPRSLLDPAALAWALLGTATAAAATTSVAAPGAGATCSARSGTQAATVVELYTSEGCSSCPPADRWASTLKGNPQTVVLAFHVNYWDRLGWPDRFASPAYTERQRQIMQSSGSRYVYTPQVVANGADWRQWPALPKARSAAAAPQLELIRDGERVWAHVAGSAGSAGAAGAPAASTVGGAARWSGYWAVVEDGHSNRIKAGENQGSVLHHDHVVRRYEPVAAWSSKTPQQLAWTPGPGSAARRIVFVLTDAQTQLPLQAVALGC